MSRRGTKVRPSDSAHGNGWVWLGILIISGAVGWFWWRAAYPSIEGRSAPLPPSTNAGASIFISSSPPAPRITNPAPLPPVRWPATDGAISNPEPALSRAIESRERDLVAGTMDQVLAAQLALARKGISSGSLDGVVGTQTRAALRMYQQFFGLRVTGQLDRATLDHLEQPDSLFTNFVVQSDDLAQLTPIPSSWLGKSTRERLDYETILELVAERTHAHPALIRTLNPGVDWTRVQPGVLLRVPDVRLPALRSKAAYIQIYLREKSLRAYDTSAYLLAYFPCSIARNIEKRPVGALRVVKVARNPNYQFNPEIFTESAEARRIGRKLTIPPGPNNPVGTAWIGLDKPGYGIHGTPEPEAVGRTESHGCFRLANWNAEYLLNLVWVGMPVYIDP